MHDSDLEDAVELPDYAPSAGADQSFSALAQVEVARLSHRGRVRLNNEEHFLGRACAPGHA